MTDDEFKSLCLEHGIALFCLHEPNGTYLKLSAACQRITGYTADELVGKNSLSHDEIRLTQATGGNQTLSSTKANQSIGPLGKTSTPL